MHQSQVTFNSITLKCKHSVYSILLFDRKFMNTAMGCIITLYFTTILFILQSENGALFMTFAKDVPMFSTFFLWLTE